MSEVVPPLSPESSLVATKLHTNSDLGRGEHSEEKRRKAKTADFTFSAFSTRIHTEIFDLPFLPRADLSMINRSQGR
jgi:hypothetical protein